MGKRTRLIFTLVVMGLAGSGLATAPAGQAASPPAVREAVLSADLRCRSVPRNIDFTGDVRIVASLPTSVVPGARFTIHPAVTFTVDPPVEATPLTVELFAPAGPTGIATINLPTTAATAITLHAAVDEPVTLTFTIPTMATVRLADGNVVDCFPTSSSGELTIPVVPPSDGSQQTFDVRATATCTDESRTFTHEFGMRGVAPARVAPGDSVPITFDWKGLASQLQERGRVKATGLMGSPQFLGFTAINGSQGVRITAGPAGRTGEVRFELERVESSLQALDPVAHVNLATCTFLDGGPVITVPITDSPTVTSTTTTTTRRPGSSLITLIKALLCTLFRVC